MKAITSAENARFKLWLRLNQSARERRKSGYSLLDGIHLVAAYQEHCGNPEEIIVSHAGLSNPEITAVLSRLPEPAVVLTDGLFSQLSTVATPTGIIAIIKTPRPELPPQSAVASIYLEDIQDPGNLGSILRSAAAAGIEQVVLSHGSVHAWSPRVLRAGMGAHFAVRIHEGADLMRCVTEFRGHVLATVRHAARPVFDADLTGAVALLFGNEGGGLSARLLEAAHDVLSIPMPGKSESLNVAAAAAVCVFERVRQQRLAVDKSSTGVKRTDQ
jgi:RNA methyltransferase, TrmH family